ncbi:MAG: hypothetical protein IJH34_11305 [Romboutsia sp.]|nr:hypothetical protein [Romboutsia sp.]
MGRMTRDEYATKEYLADKLAEQGYVTYSELFELFDLRLTYNPTVIGYMEPGLGRITLNGTLDEHTLLLVIRHEIMHEYLTHEMRAIKHLANKLGIDEEDIDDISLADIKNKLYSNDIFNIAGDYEISNRTYTDQDKKDIRSIRLNGQIVSGLVTELDHPDWVDLPMEDMYDLLEKEREEASQEAQQDLQDGDSQQGDGGESQDSQDGQSGNQSGQQSGNQSGGQSGDGEGQESDQDNSQADGGESQDSQGGQTNDKNKGQKGSGSSQSGDSEDQGDDGSEQNGQQSNQAGQGRANKAPNDGASDEFDRNSESSPSRIIHGTFKNGKFYDRNGNEIIPGGN